MAAKPGADTPTITGSDGTRRIKRVVRDNGRYWMRKASQLEAELSEEKKQHELLRRELKKLLGVEPPTTITAFRRRH
jgi:hypothetical protein